MTKRKPKDYEIRPRKDRTLDEVVVTCPQSVHLETMDRNHWWLGIVTKEGNMIHVNLCARGAIAATVEVERHD